MSETEQARWFAEEVQPHEPALRAYLLSRFPSLNDHDDIVQETYTRVLRAQTRGKVRFAKALLFTTARNAAFDLFRRARVTPMMAVSDNHEFAALEEPLGVVETINQQQEFEILAEAIHALPERCREVLILRYREGLPYKDIAVRLGIAPQTVKVQMAKGTRRCAEFFARRGLGPGKTGAREAASA